MSKSSSTFPAFLPADLQTQARLVNGGSGWEEKGFECQDSFPQKPKSSNDSPKGVTTLYWEERKKCVGEIREGAVMSPVEGAAGFGCPPTPWAEAPGGPRVPPGAEEVM